METTRGKVSYWALMVIGLTGIGYQLYKYMTNNLELSISEFGFTVVCAVLIFAPKALSEVFGKIIDNRLKN
ncbi:hypothetical protein [Algibacter sp. PT7-4]|uniref:hypothetical protein n=1 Tax=Algibacter ulvanivorans TaxID=3400999 RepID=UPI003AAC3662